jgi:hypothetical protein
VTRGKSDGGGAYPSGGTAGRRRKSFRATTFVGGEGAPVVGGGGLAREAVVRVGRSRGGVGEEWRWENERGSERGGNGSAAARQGGRKGENGGVRAWGATRCGGCHGAWP